jgi:hypothetical protein
MLVIAWSLVGCQKAPIAPAAKPASRNSERILNVTREDAQAIAEKWAVRVKKDHFYLSPPELIFSRYWRVVSESLVPGSSTRLTNFISAIGSAKVAEAMARVYAKENLGDGNFRVGQPDYIECPAWSIDVSVPSVPDSDSTLIISAVDGTILAPMLQPR